MKPILENIKNLFIKAIDSYRKTQYEIQVNYDINYNTIEIVLDSIKDNNVNFGQINYITSVYNYEAFQELLDIIYNINIENINIKFISNNYKEVEWGLNFTSKNIELDFHNINFYCDYISFNNNKISNIIIKCNTVTFNHVNLANSSSIQIYANTCMIDECTSIEDYSFIKHCNDLLEITIDSTNTFTKHNNFIGLPKDNYNLKLKFSLMYDWEFNSYIQFEGIPDTLKSIKVVSPYSGTSVLFLNHMTLKGLPLNLIDNINFGLYIDSNTYIIQIGPYKSNITKSFYNIPKQILKYVLTNEDYFINCYKKNEEPTKIYNPDNTKDKNKAIKILDKIEKDKVKKDIKQQEKVSDLNKIINHIKKYVHVGDVWQAGRYIITINRLNDEQIVYNVLNIQLNESNTVYSDWKKFIKWISSKPYKFDRSDVEVRTVIIDPIVKQIEADKKGLDYTMEIPNITKKKLNIDIVDLGNGNIGLFGDYLPYTVKIKFKALGGRFSYNLKNNGTDQPGWYISKSKQKEVEELLK